jgi:hypothetical protein
MGNIFELIVRLASGEGKKPEARLGIRVNLSSFEKICYVTGPCLNEVREEFEWLQYRNMREVFPYPLAEWFQFKRVRNYRWQFPHCEPLWVPRFDQQSKWMLFTSHPVRMKR